MSRPTDHPGDVIVAGMVGTGDPDDDTDGDGIPDSVDPDADGNGTPDDAISSLPATGQGSDTTSNSGLLLVLTAAAILLLGLAPRSARVRGT